MRKVIIIGCLAMSCLMGNTLYAQPHPAPHGHAPKREIPSPEKNARMETDRMRKALDLSDKQYDKIYKLKLKLERKRFSALTGNGMMSQRPPMDEMRGRGGGIPPMGGSGMPPMGGGMGPGMGGDRPPMGGGRMPGRPPMVNQNSAESLQKAAVKTDKKIKKLLTDEQIAKWEKMKEEEKARRPKGNSPEHQGNKFPPKPDFIS